MSKVEYIIRTEGMADSYGLGEVINPNVTLFRAGNYNLNKEELAKAISRAPKQGKESNG